MKRWPLLFALLATTALAQVNPPTVQSIGNSDLIPILPDGNVSPRSIYVTPPVLLNYIETQPLVITPPEPVWGTNYGVYNGVSVDVGAFPLTTIYTGGSGSAFLLPAAAALTGAILVPANDTGIFQKDGVAGYAAALNGQPAVGVFGWGFVLGQTNLAQIWGFNSGFSNTPYFAPLTSTGFNFDQGYGGEFDVNITKLPGGAAPAGTAFGLSIAGGSEIVPTGGAYGLYINSYMRSGLYGWSAAIDIADSPNTYGIDLGAAAVGGVSVPSQTLVFSGRNSSGTGVQVTLNANSLGNLVVQNQGGVLAQILSGSIYQYSPNASFVTNVSTDNSGNSSLISSGNFVINAGSAKPFSVQDASVTEFLVTSGSVFQYSPDATKITNYATDNSGNTTITTTGIMQLNLGASKAFSVQDNGVTEFLVTSGSVFQYSPNATKITNYSTDNSGNTTITNGAAGATFTLLDGASAVLAKIGNASPGTATKTLVADAGGDWFTQAGFTGSKVAGSCTFTLVAGSVTNVTGC